MGPEGITSGLEIFIPPAVVVESKVLLIIDLVSDELR